jgi:hypothetical protein
MTGIQLHKINFNFSIWNFERLVKFCFKIHHFKAHILNNCVVLV